jgi:RNA polymerase-binding transcription factor DksA
MAESTVRGVLDSEREATLARIATLTCDLEDIVAGSIDANADDEHDPEGSTIAFERAQVAGLISEARAYLASLDQALARVASGRYWTCRRCGEPISSERLAARPAAQTCVRCAASPQPR